MVGAYNNPKYVILVDFEFFLEPLNSPKVPETWSTPVNINQ